jgi:hypothetical protein
MFRYLYSVYCLCVTVCCTAATGCQPNCGYTLHIYRIISYHIISYHAVSDVKQLIYQSKMRTTQEDLNLKQHRCQASGLKPLIFLAVTRIPTIHFND